MEAIHLKVKLYRDEVKLAKKVIRKYKVTLLDELKSININNAKSEAHKEKKKEYWRKVEDKTRKYIKPFYQIKIYDGIIDGKPYTKPFDKYLKEKLLIYCGPPCSPL